MDETTLQEVARHMGHELSAHREFYRLQDDVIELWKVSKLLALEASIASKFGNISIDDIDFDGNYSLLPYDPYKKCALQYSAEHTLCHVILALIIQNISSLPLNTSSIHIASKELCP